MNRAQRRAAAKVAAQQHRLYPCVGCCKPISQRGGSCKRCTAAAHAAEGDGSCGCHICLELVAQQVLAPTGGRYGREAFERDLANLEQLGATVSIMVADGKVSGLEAVALGAALAKEEQRIRGRFAMTVKRAAASNSNYGKKPNSKPVQLPVAVPAEDNPAVTVWKAGPDWKPKGAG